MTAVASVMERAEAGSILDFVMQRETELWIADESLAGMPRSWTFREADSRIQAYAMCKRRLDAAGSLEYPYTLVLRAMAALFDGHPYYRDEWAL